MNQIGIHTMVRPQGKCANQGMFWGISVARLEVVGGTLREQVGSRALVSHGKWGPIPDFCSWYIFHKERGKLYGI